MKKLLPLTLALCLLASAKAAPPFDEAMKNAAADYRERTVRAAEELNRARERIAAEKAPLLEQMRAAEDRIIAAESELNRIETHREESSDQRRKLVQEFDALRKSTAYANTLASDSLKALGGGLAPGEAQFVGDRIENLTRALDDPDAGPGGRAALDIADFLLAHTQRSLGAWRADGQAMIADTNRILPGTFAFVGPETFFRPREGGAAGTIRLREGAKFPTSYPLAGWTSTEAEAFFAGRGGSIVADASGGKALRLQETSGTLWQHIRKGGVVAFAILGVGLLAALMILQKIRDLGAMSVDSPAAVARFLEIVARGDFAGATTAAARLTGTTRALLVTGLQAAGESKAILEERLQAVLLEQRLHFERRLPLLAVIATAAPLMGLLGTVVGMVRTFALITVFGTGNAAKLSSGISEVLVATELGLAVAIPTLVAHGFLAHRIQRNLALLERHALQFCTAVEAARSGPAARPEKVGA